MADTNKTPLWLDLRKEYIDDNFEKLRDYLCDCSTSAAKKDSFYDTTIELLRARVEDLIASIANRPIYNEDDDRKSTTFNATLLSVAPIFSSVSPFATSCLRDFLPLRACLR